MSEIIELPDIIKYLIFEYLHFDPDIFDRISMIYLANLFGFKPELYYPIMNHKPLHKIDHKFDAFKKIQITNIKKKSSFDCYQLIDGIRILYGKDDIQPIIFGKKPSTLILKYPTKEMLSEIPELIKNSETIRFIIHPECVDLIKDFKYSDTIKLDNKAIIKSFDFKLNTQNIIIENPVLSDELDIILKYNKNIKFLSFSLAKDPKKNLDKIIPTSVTSLYIEDIEYLPDFSGLNLLNLELINKKILRVTDSDLKFPIFSETLKSLNIGLIETLLYEGKPILPKNLEFLSIKIHPEICGLTYEKDGKLFSSFPDVETLVIDFIEITSAEDELTKMIIPKSVKNLMLINLINLDFGYQKIEFEDLANIRSLIIKNSFAIEDDGQIQKIVDLGKLESLIITLDTDNLQPFDKLLLKIPNNLKILCSSRIDMFGSMRNLLYFSTNSEL